jgi:hypothetical protein
VPGSDGCAPFGFDDDGLIDERFLVYIDRWVAGQLAADVEEQARRRARPKSADSRLANERDGSAESRLRDALHYLAYLVRRHEECMQERRELQAEVELLRRG